MASENIVPPFRVADIGGRKYILSANSRALVCCLWHSDWDGSAFANELCTVMRENANRLCHAANGEGEADGNKENNVGGTK